MNRKEEVAWVSSGQRLTTKTKQMHALIYQTNLLQKGNQDRKKGSEINSRKKKKKLQRKPKRGL